MPLFVPQAWLLSYLLRHSEALRSNTANTLLGHLRFPRTSAPSNNQDKAEAWSLIPVLVLAAVAKRRSCAEKTTYDRE